MLSSLELTFHRKAVKLEEELDSRVRFRCPVRKFLALALANDVFVDNITPESLNNCWIAPTANSRVLAIKAEMNNIPIICVINADSLTHLTKIWSRMSVNALLG